MTQRVVSVVGASRIEGRVWALCEALGAALYAEGLSVLCGGRTGVMEAVAKGYVEARERGGGGGGVVIGMLPGDDASDANAWLDVALPTGLGLARNALIARGGEAVIAVGGGSGTLSEIALAWQFGRPVCALEGSGGWSERLAGETLDERRGDDVIVRAPSPEWAARWASQVVSSG